MLFQRVTGRPLTLSLRRRGLLPCIFALLAVAMYVFLHLYRPYWAVWRLPSFFATIFQLTVCATFRLMTFNALQITSATLVRRFKVINKIIIIIIIIIISNYVAPHPKFHTVVLKLSFFTFIYNLKHFTYLSSQLLGFDGM
jgi:hypothetical protein